MIQTNNNESETTIWPSWLSTKTIIPIVVLLCTLIVVASFYGVDMSYKYQPGKKNEASKTTNKAQNEAQLSKSATHFKFPDVLEYFKLQESWQVTFDHGVNSFGQLSTAMKNQKVLMLEADLLMGSVPDMRDLYPNSNIPIMAHPPNITSDIDFKSWLKIVLKEGKAMKLDMKTLNVLLPALLILKKECSNAVSNGQLLPPLWLNADIVDGPRDKPATVFGPEFIRMCSELMPFATLSLGWGNDPEFPYEKDVLTQSMVEDMFSLCEHARQPITFAVRAALVQNSWKNLRWLLDQNPEKFSLTIYQGRVDNTHEEQIKVIQELTKGYRVFFDVEFDLSELFST
eukprot:CAMPEP_0117866848 /NCGR_PEP_ID=MMETSP0950-20121206/7619_1 /TAXON_ID=44440 /ORGANISM="Chattonella subsalsa, Strain CCMP2191" /LENGTH=342 /DNA_ID=CAMNT_0005718283 /DNA_START=76 /DNA_END=1104 /DNA_ORIENTATION=+